MPLDFLQTIAQTPAPTFDEGERALLISRLWGRFCPDVYTDSVGNVIARLGPTSGKPLVISAHLDTVFSRETHLNIRKETRRWIGPGLGDNSSSLAVLTAMLRDQRLQSLKYPVWAVANVCEEGLGDLRGMKHFLAEHGKNTSALLALDGYLGTVVARPVGVRRYRVSFETSGGHSWGESKPSAIHAASQAIVALYNIPLPKYPRTTLNVGVIEGGTSVNTIAARTEFLLDTRSLEVSQLDRLETQVSSTLRATGASLGVRCNVERVGDRPTGSLNNTQLLEWTHQAARDLGLSLKEVSSSTDANAAVPHGIPALTLGVYTGGHAHRLDEWVDPKSLLQGYRLLDQWITAYSQGNGASTAE